MKSKIKYFKYRHTHGELVDGLKVTDHPLYATWQNMKQRCSNPKNPEYINYGKRGIGVCERWLTFKNFAKDMGEKTSPLLKVERVDNDKGYSKSNCIWANQSVQSYNRRMQSNNTIGHIGVSPVGKRFRAWFSTGKRGSSKFIRGTFDTAKEANLAREDAIRRFKSGEDLSDLFEKKVCYLSRTGVSGVTHHQNKYQATVRFNGTSKYIGVYDTVNLAKEAIDKWKKENN